MNNSQLEASFRLWEAECASYRRRRFVRQVAAFLWTALVVAGSAQCPTALAMQHEVWSTVANASYLGW